MDFPIELSLELLMAGDYLDGEITSIAHCMQLSLIIRFASDSMNIVLISASLQVDLEKRDSGRRTTPICIKWAILPRSRKNGAVDENTAIMQPRHDARAIKERVRVASFKFEQCQIYRDEYFTSNDIDYRLLCYYASMLHHVLTNSYTLNDVVLRSFAKLSPKTP